jgi:activating signal cointegrator complex subunit 1
LTLGSAESMNQWRSTTLAILRKEAPQKLQAETAAVVETILTQVNSIMGSISDAQSSETRDQSLRTLITSSIELSQLLRVQKAAFIIIMPSIEGHQRTMFDAEAMEDIGGEDEDTLHEREIRCVTFPGIIKNGDENGERGHLRNVVAKIRVLCAPD